MKSPVAPSLWMCLLLPAVAGVTDPPKTNSSAPVPTGEIGNDPYIFNGKVLSDAGQGSGVVAGHPKVFFTAAHVLFDTELTGWSSPPAWEGVPPQMASANSRGYFRWSSYSGHALESGTASNQAFANDIALAWGLTPFINGAPADIDFAGNKKLKKHVDRSMITGFPASLDYEGTETEGQLHRTAPEFTAYTSDAANYLAATHISTGPGNSGGPVWLEEDSGAWNASGLLISGRPSEAGIYAFTPSIKSLLKAASPMIGDVRKSIKNGPKTVTTNTARYVLPKPRKIPDGLHKWTKIPFKVQRFEEFSLVGQVFVDLTITTEHVGDLIVGLLSPSGHLAIIHNGEGAGENNLILDDFAVAFDEDDWSEVQAVPNGTWSLVLQDRLTGDICTVTRFELEIRTDDVLGAGGEEP